MASLAADADQVQQRGIPLDQHNVEGPLTVILLKCPSRNFLLFGDMHVRKSDVKCATAADTVDIVTFLKTLLRDPRVRHPIDFFLENYNVRYTDRPAVPSFSSNYLNDIRNAFQDCFAEEKLGCDYPDDLFHRVDIRWQPMFHSDDPNKELFDVQTALKRICASSNKSPDVVRSIYEQTRPKIVQRFQAFYQDTYPKEFRRVMATLEVIDRSVEGHENPNEQCRDLSVTLDDFSLTFGWLYAVQFLYKILFRMTPEEVYVNKYTRRQLDFLVQHLFPKEEYEMLNEIDEYLLASKINKQFVQITDPPLPIIGADAFLEAQIQYELMPLYRKCRQAIDTYLEAKDDFDPNVMIRRILDGLVDIMVYYMDLYTFGRMLKTDSKGDIKHNIVYYAGEHHLQNLVRMIHRVYPAFRLAHLDDDKELSVMPYFATCDATTKELVMRLRPEIANRVIDTGDHDVPFQCLPLKYDDVVEFFRTTLTD